MRDASEAELRYLRAIADRQAVDRATSVVINVDGRNVSNSVSGGGGNIDGLVRELVDTLEESLASDAEGVPA